MLRNCAHNTIDLQQSFYYQRAENVAHVSVVLFHYNYVTESHNQTRNYMPSVNAR